MTAPETMKMKRLLDGLGLVESPRWHDGKLWFADWNAGAILALDNTGVARTVARVPSLPLSFDFLPDGSLIAVSAPDAKLLRKTADGELALYAQLPNDLQGRWNEIVIDGRGNCYVNGPALALVRPDGRVDIFAEGFAFPNGMAITPDNRTLIVAELHGHRLTAFDIAPNGEPSRRRIWAQLGPGTPDGISADAEGCIWFADVPNRCCVRVREGGEVLQRVELDRGAFACMLGGNERRTLFITAAEWRGMDQIAQMPGSGQILSIDVTVAGAGWP